MSAFAGFALFWSEIESAIQLGDANLNGDLIFAALFAFAYLVDYIYLKRQISALMQAINALEPLWTEWQSLWIEIQANALSDDEARYRNLTLSALMNGSVRTSVTNAQILTNKKLNIRSAQEATKDVQQAFQT